MEPEVKPWQLDSDCSFYCLVWVNEWKVGMGIQMAY